MPKTIYLLDGHALAYRAFFALMASGSRFRTRTGEPTAGTYGFTNILLKIIEQDKPEYLAVAFDTGKTFRHDLYDDYKATREKMPDDLIPQIERIREVVDAFNIPRLEMPGYEADDVLGSVANEAVQRGFGVKIITGDRDLLQLVDDRVIINLTGSKMSDAQDYFREDVKKSLGVFPDQVVDYKALIGDTSDNIPGIKGIGQKTADKLLEEFSHLDDIYANLDKISGRTRTLLEAGKDSAYLSYDLARIRTDLPIKIDFEQARTREVDIDTIIAILKDLEFRSSIERVKKIFNVVEPSSFDGIQPDLFSTNEPVNIAVDPQYKLDVHIVDSKETLSDLVATLEKAQYLSFDTETTSTDPMLADMVGISIATEPGSGFYIPVGHKNVSKQLDLDLIREALNPFFMNSDLRKVGHHLKYDCIILVNHGFTINGLYFDTMIAGWLLEPSSRRLGLKTMSELELGISMTHIEELIGSGKNQLSMADIAVEQVAPYAAADAEVPLKLMKILKERLEKNQLLKVLDEIEMPLIPILIDMERNGIAIDKDFFKQFSHELSTRMREIEKKIYEILGYPININSTQQLSKALFTDLGLTPPDSGNKTKSGHYSTSASVLEEMRGQHVLVDLILEYRELTKLVSTYLDTLPRQVNPRTNKIHTSFSQTGSVTGRLSSSDPNLQNIPTRTELGHEVRRGFIADKGQLLVSVDYSQIELRVVAHMSQDQAMLDAFRHNMDIHAATAAAIYNVPMEEVTKDQRRHAKAINFGLIYGMSAFGLSRSTDLTLAEAENFVKTYFERFPGVKSYLDSIRKQAASEGYVETMLGRRRYFPNLKNPVNAQLKAREEREAINAPIQGTAADILKIAMIQLKPAIEKAQLKTKMLIQVHDELVLECSQEELDATIKLVKGIMEKAYKLDIPLSTDARYGNNWAELK
ncbi:MAG: DNA polymerase I [Chloroflexi bacterium]|nr:DNA polymerase I [Chloroflexota bacterium]